MSTPVLTFFNNKGGVGKTSLVYHLTWMFAELGKTVVAVDLDPQANLTAAFIDEEELKRLENWEQPEFDLPNGNMQPLGYLVQQHSVRLSRPVKAYDRWVKQIPVVYRESVLDEKETTTIPAVDPYCLTTIKHYRSLIPMAQEKRKPIFKLTSSDGAIGAHAQSVKDAYDDFEKLARKIWFQLSGGEEL